MADPRDLVVEANERFWKLTGYKRGKRLSRSDPADVRMMPVWMDVYRQVANERLGSSRQPVTAPAPAAPSPVREQPVARDPMQAESAGMSGPMKGALIAGGVVVAGLLGKFLFTEAKYYGIAKSLERKSKAPRRAKAAG